MKRLAPLLALLPLGLLAQDEGSKEIEPQVSGALRFATQDHLNGSPVGIDPDGNLVWDASEHFHEPIPFHLPKLLEMRLQGGPQPPFPEGHQALVTLTNKDAVRGQLIGLDDEYVTVRTWYAGDLKFKRSMTTRVEIMRAEAPIYAGPTNIKEWTEGEGESGAWKLQGGALTTSKGAGIARKIKFPERSRITFDLNWQKSLRFRVLLFSDDGTTSQPDNCYDLVCQKRFIYLRKRWMTRATGGSRNMGQANLTQFTEKDKIRFDFFIDRKAGKIALYLNGNQAQVWEDEDPKIGSFGNWLHFVSDEFYKVEVSRIRVSPWSGQLPEETPEADLEDYEEGDGQLMHLQNGDVIVGKVGKIVEGVVDLKTKFTDIKIPVARMRTIDLTPSLADYEEPILKAGDIRAWLREGGQITFRLDGFKDGVLKGYSQTFGESEFKLSAFSRIEFNIHDEDLKAMRSGNW